VFFQPRFEPWYDWHQTFDCMPEAYRGLSLFELIDGLGVSMRYCQYYTGAPDPVERRFRPPAEVIERTEGERRTLVYRTPLGDLVEGQRYTIDHTWRTVDFPVRSPGDLKALRWLYDHAEYTFSAQKFALGRQVMGERGVPQFWVPKSPYMALAQWWMELPDLIYALADERDEVEATFAAIDAAYEPLYEQLIACGQAQIVNFGENLHEALFGPRYFSRYLVPWYEKRSGQLRRAGIFTHVHLDGYFHSLLGFLKELPFDGLEALTPTPQGDVTLEEMKAAIGDKVLLDGIPAVLFMDTYSREELMATVERIVELFAPRLVLGVSDEVPEGTAAEAMERVRLVAEYCRRTKN
jgi:hypothetical protein